MVNVKNCNFLKVKCRFLLVIGVKWKQSVCSITLLYSSTFYSLFIPFFVLEIFKFNYDTFFIRNSAAISKFDWFEQPCTGHHQQQPCWNKMIPWLFATVYKQKQQQKYSVCASNSVHFCLISSSSLH